MVTGQCFCVCIALARNVAGYALDPGHDDLWRERSYAIAIWLVNRNYPNASGLNVEPYCHFEQRPNWEGRMTH
jgi:sugar (pentulose or hexulose) kinase